MARERITLVADEVKRQEDIRWKIKTGEMNPEVYATLTPDEKTTVSSILFEMSSEKIEPNQGTSALEFILFAFMRLTNKKLNGMSLTAEDKEIEDTLQTILDSHEITDGETPKTEWLFDYMQYAQAKSADFLRNRKDHINRKKNTIGEA